jgi:hypothetical protein
VEALIMSESKRTYNYVSSQPGLEEWMRDFSAYLRANPDKNTIIYPESFASGYAKVYCLEEGLTYRIVDYRLNTDFVFSREASDKFYLIIYFYRYKDCKDLSVVINNKLIISSKEENYSSLLMTNSHVAQTLTLTKGTHIKGVTIQMTEDWLREKINPPDTANYALFKE